MTAVPRNNPNDCQAELQECRDACEGLHLDNPNLSHLDGVHIPARLLEQAKAIAVVTVVKGGFGLAGVEFGTWLVVARLPNDDEDDEAAEDDGSSSYHTTSSSRWSPPSAICLAGISWGGLIATPLSDHVFVCMTDAAVELLFAQQSVQLGPMSVCRWGRWVRLWKVISVRVPQRMLVKILTALHNQPVFTPD